MSSATLRDPEIRSGALRNLEGPGTASQVGIAAVPTRPVLAPVPDPAPRPQAWRSSGRVAVASAVLLAADLVSFALAAVALAPWGSAAGTAPHVLVLAASAALIQFWCDSLYPGYGVYPHELMRRRIAALFKVGAIGAAGAWLLTGGAHLSALLVAFLAIALALQPAARALARSALRRLDLWGMPVAIIGAESDAAALRKHLDANWQYGIRCGRSDASAGDDVADVALLLHGEGDWDHLHRNRQRFTEVIAFSGIPGTSTPPFRAADRRGEIGLRLRPSASAASGPGWAGRALDLTAAGFALFLAAPVLVFAVAAIYLSDPGPVLYRQTREGLGGRTFRMLKLRTMYLDADQRLEALLAADEAARAEWTRHFKLRNDPRILPAIGSFLRASSIDELPQLLNVVAGDMRMVGPRPFPLYHLAALDAEFRAKRCTVMPGLTGLWQISGRSSADLERQQELDGFYIDNRSFWFDAHILLRTAAAVFRGEGAY